jgi:hypothetical protein
MQVSVGDLQARSCAPEMKLLGNREEIASARER